LADNAGSRIVRRVIVRTGMAPREASLDYEALQAHWRTDHADLAGQLEGLRSYVQNHAVLEDGRPLLPYVGFDACSELEWDSLEAMDAAFASEHYRQAVVADERSLIDKSRFLLLLSERRVLRDGDPGPDAVKLLTYLPLDARSTTDELFDVLAGPYAEIAAEAEPLRHEQLLELPGAHEGRLPPVFRAVDILWFATPDEAVAFVHGDLGHRAGYELAGRAFGLERLVARPFRVV
jgi:uncharacterized protein (TIGR02118 family)